MSRESSESEARSVSMIGLGDIGSVIARRLVDCDHAVTVWNRTPEKMDPLVQVGAHRAASAADAFDRNELTILCLRDAQAVSDLLREWPAAPRRGRALVNLTTLSGDEPERLAAWCAERNIAYLQGGVNGYPWNIGTADGSINYSGHAEIFGAYEGMLGCLAGRQVYLGPDPGSVAALGTAMWSYYYIAVLAFYEAAAVATEAGVAFEQFMRTTHEVVIPHVTGRHAETAKRLASGDFAPDHGPLTASARVVDRYASTYKGLGLQNRFIEATRAYMASAVEAGDGDKNIDAVVRTVWAKPGS